MGKVREMGKEPKSQEEIEGILTIALKEQYPDVERACLEPGDSGWQCYVVRMTPSDEEPIVEGDYLLAELLERHMIVEEEGGEDPEKL